MTGIVVALATLAALNAVFALLIILLRVFNERSASRRARQEETWYPKLIGMVSNDSDPEALREEVEAGERDAVVEIAWSVARRVRGADRERVRRFASPLLSGTIADLGSRRAETRARALQIVSCLGEERHEAIFVTCLDDPSPLVSLVAARALCQPSRARWVAGRSSVTVRLW
jgi:hypothetical protein